MAASKPTSWLSESIHIFSHLGPPEGFTAPSPWPWVDHPASGLLHATPSPFSDSLSLRLHLARLNLALHTATRRLIKQKARSQTLESPKALGIVLLLLVGMRFQELFHSPHWGTFHLSLTVLVHYRSRTTI